MSSTSYSPIIGPILAMMMLTFVVWIVMYVRRIRFLVSERVHPQRLTTRERLDEIVPEQINYAANNFRNLIELPVLFYALCLYLHVTNRVDLTYVVAAWTFVGFRILHSIVHCTMNHVMTRFRLYMAASVALWFMLLRAVVQLIA